MHRHPERGCYDRDVINQIIDEALLCHIAFIDNGQPFVIPTVHVRVDELLYIHGSNASRMIAVAGSGAPGVHHVDHPRWPGAGAIGLLSLDELSFGGGAHQWPAS